MGGLMANQVATHVRMHTDTIPRIDEVSYLFETLAWVAAGRTFEDIRKDIVQLRLERDHMTRADERRGMSASKRLREQDEFTYWVNARDALKELMRLGLVEGIALPSRPAQLAEHRARTYMLRPEGRQFL